MLQVNVISSTRSLVTRHTFHPFRRRFPRVHFRLCRGSACHIVGRLRSGILSLTVMHAPFRSSGLAYCALIGRRLLTIKGGGCFSSSASCGAGRALSASEGVTATRPSRGMAVSLGRLTRRPLVICRH